MVNAARADRCAHCGSADVVRDGKRGDGVQKYLCRSCGKRFNPLTNTVFDSRKIPVSEWVEFLLHLFEFHSVKTSARDNRNAGTTGVYWLRKVFAVFGGVPGIRRPLRRGLDRRDLRFRRQSGQGNKGREGAPRHIEEQNRDSGRDRRERPRRHARMGFKAIEEKDFRNIPPPHSPRPQAHPRRGQFPFAFGFGTWLGERGASSLRDEGAAGFRKPDGQNQRGAFPIQSVPQEPRGLREGRPSGLV